MEPNRDLEVILIPEATGLVFDGLDLGVEAFAGGIADAVTEIRQQARQVASQHVRHLDHRLQTRVRGPEVPALPGSLRPPASVVLPPPTQLLFEDPRPGRLQV